MSTLRLCVNALRSSCCRPRRLQYSYLTARNAHARVPLRYPIEAGLGEFLPPAALKVVAVDYQDGLLKQLNEETRGSEYEGMSVVTTLTTSLDDPFSILISNLASLAINNHFFLDHLKPPPTKGSTHQDEMSSTLRTQITDQYGSIAQLKSTFSAATLGMFSSGYIWLVTDSAGRMAIIPTFGAGTLLVRSRQYKAPMDDLKDLDLRRDELVPGEPFYDEYVKEVDAEWDRLAKEDELTEEGAQLMTEAEQEELEDMYKPRPNEQSEAFAPVSTFKPPYKKPWQPGEREYHTSARTLAITDPSSRQSPNSFSEDFSDRLDPGKDDINNLGDVLYPLFCVSVHEHAWMSAGYGVWGKEEWMKKFWSVLDWAKVSDTYARVASGTSAKFAKRSLP
ncbi:manganese superoxide dismutase [Desarmillaria ectypa]|nr:manganese superoxide dismutase [Desarmillaria ectypa]